MTEPIRFYFDFGSPYAYFALKPLRTLAAKYDREIALRPVILWAVFKAQGLSDPMAADARKSYMLADMARSADYFGVPFQLPVNFRKSTHRASRLYYSLVEERPELGMAVATAIFESAFVRGADITDPEAIAEVQAAAECDRTLLGAKIESATGRNRLQEAVDSAVRDGALGSPFFIVDGEGFFGADRLSQIDWRLRQTKG